MVDYDKAKLPSYILNTILVCLLVGGGTALLSSWIWSPVLVNESSESLYIGGTGSGSGLGYFLLSRDNTTGRPCAAYDYTVTFDRNLESSDEELYNALDSCSCVADGQTVPISATATCSANSGSEYALRITGIVCLSAFLVGLCLMNLILAVSNSSSNTALSSFYSGACCFVGSFIALIVVMFVYNSPNNDRASILRLVFLFILCVLACFLCLCVYVTSVTYRLTTITDTYWSNGAVTRSSSTEDYGYVKCKNWPCLQC